MDRRNLTAKVSKQDDNTLKIEFTPNELKDELKEESEHAQEKFEGLTKYTPLKIWADFLIGKDSKSSRHEEFENNPLLALEETKQLVKEFDSRKDSVGMFDYSTPVFSCSKLMIEYSKILSKEEKIFCKDIILSSLESLFSDGYGYQISDGVEASIHAIPSCLVQRHPRNLPSLQ